MTFCDVPIVPFGSSIWPLVEFKSELRSTIFVKLALPLQGHLRWATLAKELNTH